MSAELNRRIAEADGWRCVQVEAETVTICKPPNSGTVRVYAGAYVIFNPAGEAIWTEGNIRNPEEAWDYATRYLLPDYSGDPTAALAKLAGVRYTHHHSPRGIQMPGSYEYTDRVIIEEDHAHYAANANTFAEAAAMAWDSWKEAGE